MVVFYNMLVVLVLTHFMKLAILIWRKLFFWLSTFLNLFINYAFSLKILSLYSLIAFFLFILILILQNIFFEKFIKHSSFTALIGFLLILIGLYLPTYKSVKMFFENSDSFDKVTLNFSNDIKLKHSKPRINVFLYIGESTTSMNMGIQLSTTNNSSSSTIRKKNGFIKFENVFSTYIQVHRF